MNKFKMKFNRYQTIIQSYLTVWKYLKQCIKNRFLKHLVYEDWPPNILSQL
jgi:hypothetical protein